MKYHPGRVVLASFFLCAGLSAPGGCPWQAPPMEAALSAPPAGTYYVEQQEDKLHYYQPAAVRGADGQWIELSDSGAWFRGPGFYRLSEERVWSLDEDAIGLTLDEFLQLYDPPPAAHEMP